MNAPATDVDVVVIGGGPAGLCAADLLVRAGRSTVVLEGRDRVGGRLLSVPTGGVRLDLGATWFWPNEPRVNGLVGEERLATFDQHLAGDAIFQTDQGTQRMQGNQIDAPSSRLIAGTQSLAEALAARLPEGVLHLETAAHSIEPTGNQLLTTSGNRSWRSDHVVVAVPPATAVARIDFNGSLPRRVHALAAATPVWMGNIVKVVARYHTTFWRDQGLAGAAFSYAGPMRELHDMSGPNGAPAALFGFAQPGLGGAAPTRDAVCAQLAELFGGRAATPTELFIRDWRAEPLTSPDHGDELTNYQTYGHPLFGEPTLGARLHWASTETATMAPGHIEGALQAASRAVGAILGSSE